MVHALNNLNHSVLLAAEASGDGVAPAWLSAMPLLPLVAVVLCLGCLAMKVRSKAPAWLTVGLLGAGFAVAVGGFLQWGGHGPEIATIFEWIGMETASGGSLTSSFGFYMDGLSWLWMLFVMGLGTLIALYASEYMAGDPGYGRFFAAFALFVFSMACLVMADNLILLYLGWEGVGLCSYLLIGYYYTKPSAVAAAKKAFIVNRIGDLGLALGLFLTFVTFQTVEYAEIFRLVEQGIDAQGRDLGTLWQTWAIPLLLMVGAFGKSAQLPLYVWLPDAMEGPTPVSALIHAATMVTAGVYLVARFYPLFTYPDVPHYALWTVAWIGALTALLAATIGMAQFDIKRIMAYSTVSQLGYMFAGLGVLTSIGGAFHVFTHAFFKALLFLACGAVMHGFAGQLDLRRLSGLRKMSGWGIVSITMLVGCLNLAGFPLITSGFYSKDMIMAEAFVTPGARMIGWILVLTAGLTAYYTFRVYFRVFEGPEHYEPGDEHHGGNEEEHGAAAHDGHEEHAAHDEHAHDHEHFHPHAPGWAINTVLVILALLTFVGIGTYFVDKEHHGWVGGLVHNSTAEYTSPHAQHGEQHATVAPTGARLIRVAEEPAPTLGLADAEDAHGKATSHSKAGGFFSDPHKWMYVMSSVVGLFGILVAWWLHLAGRTEAATSRADKLLPMLGPVASWAQHKWYVDELYDFLLRIPLWVIGNLCYWFDKLVIDGLIDGIGKLPGLIAGGLRPSQSGVLQGYAVGMAGGLGLILLIVWIMVQT